MEPPEPVFVFNGIAWVAPWDDGGDSIDPDCDGSATDHCGDGVFGGDDSARWDGSDVGGVTCGDLLFSAIPENHPDALSGSSSQGSVKPERGAPSPIIRARDVGQVAPR